MTNGLYHHWPGVRSRWLHVGQDAVKDKISKIKSNWPISNHLHQTSLVNKGFNTKHQEHHFLVGVNGLSQPQHRIWVILPTCRVSHVIKQHITCPRWKRHTCHTLIFLVSWALVFVISHFCWLCQCCLSESCRSWRHPWTPQAPTSFGLWSSTSFWKWCSHRHDWVCISFKICQNSVQVTKLF